MLKTSQVSDYIISIAVEPQELGGYIAYSPDWEDSYAQGETVEEAINELLSVTKNLIEIYKNENLVIPLQPHTKEPLSLPKYVVA